MRTTSAAPLLKEPGGIRVASLISGQSYQIGRSRGSHIEMTVEGWVPASAVQATTRDGFDLAVISGNGENLRAAPGGATVARLVEGTLLNKLATRGTWIRVRRAGWVARDVVTAESAVGLSPAPDSRPAAQASAPAPAPTTAAAPVASTTQPPDTVRPPVDSRPAGTVAGAATLRQGASLSATPDGQPIGTLSSPADVEVLERTRDWVKIRFEGWVRAGDVAAEAASGPRITAAMLRDQPDKYVGQTVTWRIQFLAVQEADALRPEMPRGQPYVLARGPLPESGFTYLMVSKEQAAEFRRFAPLDEVRVEAIIRAGRTKYLPTPVMELVKVTR